MRAVESILGNGIPLAKADGLRPLLERTGFSLTDKHHLSLFIPKILHRERQKLHAELEGKLISFIFDGTTRLGEAVNIIYRFCQPDFSEIVLRLVDFTTTEKHMNASELAQHLNKVLISRAKINSAQIVACSRDSCSTNGAGLRIIKPLLPAMADFMCYSHMLHGTGSRFTFDSLDQFISPLLILHKMPVVKSIWMQVTGCAMKGFES